MFLEAAETIDTLNDAESYADVIATLAVHAGIAASDAFCLLMLGQHSIRKTTPTLSTCCRRAEGTAPP
ncbi:hypothetical protein ACQCSU_12880 [Pseudarthrobacter sp. O4]|uniref:hypothetical protein n=1 Tax=Pseudarthrobacter sp. O4 TaxID=3418417 RepID=UPI003CF04C17